MALRLFCILVVLAGGLAESRPAGAAGSVRIHQFNMSGQGSHLGDPVPVVAEIYAEVTEDSVLGGSLNEVCLSQYTELRDLLRPNGWYTKFWPQRGGNTGRTGVSGDCNDQFGVAAFAKAHDGTPTTYGWYQTQESASLDKGRRGWACVPGAYFVSWLVCSTHLTSLGQSSAPRAGQALEYFQMLASRSTRIRFAGGDFNEQPGASMFTSYYNDYWEADQNRIFSAPIVQSTKCYNADLKIDYIWAIKDSTTTTGYAAKSCDIAESDHKYYKGYFDWDV